MTKSDTHPKLQNPPLVEVVLELIFISKTSANTVHRELGPFLKKFYPRDHFNKKIFKEDLNSDDVRYLLTEDLPEHELAYKYDSDSNPNHSFSFGNNRIRINTAIYEGFRKYIDFVSSLIEEYDKIAGIEFFNEISIRYINYIGKIDIESLENRINPHPLSEIIEDGIFSHGIQQFSYRFADGVHMITIATPPLDKDDATLILDLEHRAVFKEPVQIDNHHLIDWIDIAHDRIYTSFANIVGSKYIALKGG